LTPERAWPPLASKRVGSRRAGMVNPAAEAAAAWSQSRRVWVCVLFDRAIVVQRWG
jgi:hypothetical protein